MENNNFISNSAETFGSCLYISNENSNTNTKIISNYFGYNLIFPFSPKIIGSAIHLSNPSNISIHNNTFYKNQGKSGACIYYEEINRYFNFSLVNNSFIENIAEFGGGALYLFSSYASIKLNQNFFWNNKADYGNDFTSRPFRVRLNINYDRKNIFDLNKSNYFTIFPGKSNINLKFYVCDYFDQNIKHLNGSTILELKDTKEFTNFQSTTNIKLDGLLYASIQKGSFISY